MKTMGVTVCVRNMLLNYSAKYVRKSAADSALLAAIRLRTKSLHIRHCTLQSM